MNQRLVFVGNRRFVLEEIIHKGCDLALAVIVRGSHLERDYHAGLLPSSLDIRFVASKKELIDILREASPFDVLVSNGCPYILPISQLPKAKYINIHPSLLPDLRGVDPVIGSILFERDAGATCHVMDEGIDTGDIISQVSIPYTKDLDVTTLYQLSFIAEREAFSLALSKDFSGGVSQGGEEGAIYFSRRTEDSEFSFTEPVDVIFRKIRAFNNKSIGCRFYIEGRTYRVFGAERMVNPYLRHHVCAYDPGVVVFSYEGSIVFRIGDDVIRFKDVQSEDGLSIPVGTRLF